MSTATIEAPKRRKSAGDGPTINRELAQFMPELSKDAYKRLEERILAEGCITPIRVWKETGDVIADSVPTFQAA